MVHYVLSNGHLWWLCGGFAAIQVLHVSKHAQDDWAEAHKFRAAHRVDMAGVYMCVVLMLRSKTGALDSEALNPDVVVVLYTGG
jgi:hypothetical protein